MGSIEEEENSRRQVWEHEAQENQRREREERGRALQGSKQRHTDGHQTGSSVTKAGSKSERTLGSEN